MLLLFGSHIVVVPGVEADVVVVVVCWPNIGRWFNGWWWWCEWCDNGWWWCVGKTGKLKKLGSFLIDVVDVAAAAVVVVDDAADDIDVAVNSGSSLISGNDCANVGDGGIDDDATAAAAK